MTNDPLVLDGPGAVRWCDRCKASVPLVEWKVGGYASDGRIVYVHYGTLRDLAPYEPPSKCGFVFVRKPTASKGGTDGTE